MMRRAVVLARKGEGHVEPNPMVGCVVVRSGRVIGEGYHRRFGGPHAEIDALRRCKEGARGSTVYVSLEPCSHQGKTPPCSEALIEAGVARVVAALRDPNPAVRGGGLRHLRKAGIAVEVGAGCDDAADLVAPFITYTTLGRPFVIAKWAQSLDGKLASRTGDSKWISGEASRRSVHRLRARVDAILVGSRTVIADNPLLTARDVPLRRQALRVVLDGRLQIPEMCRIVVTARAVPTLVMTSTARSRTPKAKRLKQKGVEVMSCRITRGRLALGACLAALRERGVTNLLVEGGSTVLTSFFDAGVVDRAMVFVAPRLIGGRDAPTALEGHGAGRLVDAITPHGVRIRRSGSDVLYDLRLTDPLAIMGGRPIRS